METQKMKIEELSDERYIVHKCKDGRYRAYDKIDKKNISYPRVVMERKLGRKLNPDEQVHHIDGDPSNNDDTNLEIVMFREHQRIHSQKYFDKIAICEYCGKEFLWTAKQQRYFYSNISRKDRQGVTGPFCSKRCTGKYSMSADLVKSRKK